jgi:hypothetical protein
MAFFIFFANIYLFRRAAKEASPQEIPPSEKNNEIPGRILILCWK